LQSAELPRARGRAGGSACARDPLSLHDALPIYTPALQELAMQRGLPISGKDFKTGQTWMKTVIAPGLKARMLGLAGWYSTNILGDRKSTRLNSSHVKISYAVFCAKEKMGQRGAL